MASSINILTELLYGDEPVVNDCSSGEGFYNWVTCCNAVQSTPEIEIDAPLSAERWDVLMTILGNADVSQVRSLVFPIYLTVEKVTSLAMVLEKGRFSALRKLDLFSCDLDIGLEGSEAVAKALRLGQLHLLRHLGLPGCDFKTIAKAIVSGNIHLLTSFTMNSTRHSEQKKVDMLGNDLDFATTYARTQYVTQYTSPHLLTEDVHDILSSGFFSRVQHLELSKDCLGGSDGFRGLVWGVHNGKFSALTVLNMNGSPVTLKRADLGELVRAGLFKSIQYLYLDYCGILSHQVSKLADALVLDRHILPLQGLSLRSNKLDDSAVAALVRLSTENLLPQLQEFDLSLNLEIKNSLAILVTAIRRGELPSLVTLKWEGNRVTDVEAEAVVNAYTQKTSVIADIKIEWSSINDLSLKTKAVKFRARNLRLAQAREDLKEEIAGDAKDLHGVPVTSVSVSLDEVPVRSAKVFLCGFPSVGKTKLRKSLQRSLGLITKLRWERHPTFLQDPRTRGIELRRIEEKKTNGDSLTLVLWDLAGQEEFHVMHGTFVPDLGLAAGKTTTFVIVFRARFTKTTEAELLYWLRFVASSSLKDVKRRVVVVLNCFHGKQCPDHERSLWRELIQKFELMFRDLLNIHLIPFTVDARVASSVKELKDQLFFEAEILLEDVRMPGICRKLLEELKGSSEGHKKEHLPILSWEAFERGLELKATFPTGTLRAATRYLHEMGEIIFFSEETLEMSNAESRSLVVPYPEWFCRRVVGQLLLPKKMLEDGESSVTELLCDDGSISKIHFQAYFKHLLAEPTRVEDVVSMLVRMGLCYRMGQEKILIPTLIRKDDLSTAGWEGRGVRWVMGRSLVPEDKERTCFPMTLFRRLQVELAQDERFGGLGDSKYRAGKSYSIFKVSGMLILVQFDVDHWDPTDDRVDILVKCLVREEDSEVMRLEQINYISSIMYEVERLCVDCCPGVRYDRKVIKPWSAADETCAMSERELLSVREIKNRIQKHGTGKYTSWEVRGEPVKEVSLLSLGELEEIHALSAQIFSGLKDDAIVLGLLPADSLPGIGVESGSYFELPRSSMEEISRGSEGSEVITKGYLRQQLEEVKKTVVETVREDGKLTRQHLDQRTKELGKSIRDAQQNQNLLLRYVQALQRFSIEEKEHSVPRYMFLSKRDKPEKSIARVWITLKEAFQNAFQLHLLCEARYEDGVIPEVKDQEGIEIKKSKEWLVQISPWLRWSLNVAILVAKVASQVVLPGIIVLIPNLEFKERDTLRRAVDTAAALPDEQLSKEELPGQRSEGKYGVAEAPINLKERRIAEAIVCDLMREIGDAAFAEKIGLRKVLLNETVQPQVHNSRQGEPCVVWICNACYEKYGPRVKDITGRT